MTDLTRRQYLGGVAALAASRWENEDYDIRNVENWEPLGNDLYVTGEITPDEVTATAGGEFSRLTFNEDFTERTALVTYWADGVSLSIEAKGVGNVRAGQLLRLTTDQARKLAAMLSQAGGRPGRDLVVEGVGNLRPRETGDGGLLVGICQVEECPERVHVDVGNLADDVRRESVGLLREDGADFRVEFGHGPRSVREMAVVVRGGRVLKIRL